MRRRARRILAGALIVLLGWLCWIGYMIWAFGARDDARNSDCAIVLGAAAYGSDPSPVFEQRIRHAIELYQRKMVSKLIFTGGYGVGASHAESEVAAEYAIRAGVPKADVLTETHSRTTKQNLAEAKAVMEAHHLRNAVIVSDPLHLKRAAMMAADLKIAAVTSPTATTRYRSVRAKVRFLIREIYFIHHYVLTGQ